MANVSQQWRKLTEEQFGNVDAAFLDTFRAPGAPNKFVAWDPYERSTRYFKFLLLTSVRRKSERFFEAYAKLRNREQGGPISVRCHDCDIDADYLAAVEEWEFLTDAHALDTARRVVEIGAGFGRTAHTLLTLAASIETYTIVDLPQMLALSRAYLARVAPKAPVQFVSSEDHIAINTLPADLVINIDSFQEMPPAVIDFYMRAVVSRAPLFYCKNPVGKYLPASVGMPGLRPEQMLDVLSLGYCREVIDIFDEDALRCAREAFLAAYRPAAAAGEEYRVAATRAMDLFPYFVHVLYSREAPSQDRL